MGFSDKFKKVTERAQQLAEQAVGDVQEAAETAKNKSVEVAGENRERIGSAIDKTAAAVSERTGDKYADKIDSARAKAHQGLDKVADAGADAPTDAAEPPAPGATIPDPAPAPPPAPGPAPTPGPVPTPEPMPTPEPTPDPLPPVEPIPDPEPLPGS